MTDKYILDTSGSPVPEPDIIAWGKWFAANTDKRIVARNSLGDITVSTVFLGLDHSWGRGRPLLYETMIFRDGLALDEQWHHSTKQEALDGHAAALILVRSRNDVVAQGAPQAARKSRP